MAHILVIEDESILANSLADALRIAGHEVTCAGTGEEGLAESESTTPDLVLLDVRLPGIDGIDVLRQLRRSIPTAAVVMMTAYGNVPGAVEAMRDGASDYLTKPINIEELTVVVERALDRRQLMVNLSYFRDRERSRGALTGVLGSSAAMTKIRDLVQRFVASPAIGSDAPPSVLITGETGTGKDLIARAIHFAGPRKDQSFVHVNCTALPDQLVEAELFGHVKGAFTDARSDKLGLFEVADGGTLFLDEIGHMPSGLQAKLLSALEHQTIRPVGSTRDRKINVHVISATNIDPASAIESGHLRSDLFHRLRVLSLHLPRLRDRDGDLDELADHFLRMYASRFRIPMTGMTDEARRQIAAHDWPGNVRELAHVIESAVLIADGPRLLPQHLNLCGTPPAGELAINVSDADTIHLSFTENGVRLDDVEYQLIQATLNHTRQNLSQAARILGISRDAVRYRMERYRSKHPNP